MTSSYLNVLLVFVPLGFVAEKLHWDAVWIFSLNFLAIVPLAKVRDRGSMCRRLVRLVLRRAQRETDAQRHHHSCLAMQQNNQRSSSVQPSEDS